MKTGVVIFPIAAARLFCVDIACAHLRRFGAAPGAVSRVPDRYKGAMRGIVQELAPRLHGPHIKTDKNWRGDSR